MESTTQSNTEQTWNTLAVIYTCSFHVFLLIFIIYLVILLFFIKLFNIHFLILIFLSPFFYLMLGTSMQFHSASELDKPFWVLWDYGRMGTETHKSGEKCIFYDILISFFKQYNDIFEPVLFFLLINIKWFYRDISLPHSCSYEVHVGVFYF